MFSYNVQELLSNKRNYSKVNMSPEFFSAGLGESIGGPRRTVGRAKSGGVLGGVVPNNCPPPFSITEPGGMVRWSQIREGAFALVI